MIGKLSVEFSLRHVWLIKLINYPRVFFGFDVAIPKCCIKFGDVKSELTEL